MLVAFHFGFTHSKTGRANIKICIRGHFVLLLSARDLPINYVGSTSTYDKTMSKIPPDGRAWIKSWSLVIGIAIPIKEMR